MKINSLSLFNVRNHLHSKFELPEETIFTGANGSGKTTVLEAVYLLLAMKGFKKQPLSGVTSFNQPFMKIVAETEEKGRNCDITLKYDCKKSLLTDGTPVESLSDYIFSKPVACHTPDNPGILSREQSERRSFLDRFSFYAEKRHIDDIRTYNRFITQKAAELDGKNPDGTYIEVINNEIIRLSGIISGRRKGLIAVINKELDKVYTDAAFKIDPVFISYQTNINNRSILDKEILKRRCDYGIHRDRIDMSLGGKLIEKFSSFGQKKTFSMLVLLAVMKHIEELRKISIITLLDDFEAGLDGNRAAMLRESFSNGRQTIYTGVENIRLGFKNTIFLQG